MSKEKENHYLHPWTQKALKYMLFKIVGFLLGAVTLLPSCEKAISFKPHNAEALAVVEASIENGKYPTVFLSQSQNYFSRISPGQLDSSFIHGANITVSNGTLTSTLIEYTLPAQFGYKVSYYTVDSSDMAHIFTGELGKSYSLQIKTSGRTYTATTTIPLLKRVIDSLWWVKAPNNPDSTKAVLMGRFTDPPGLGNYIRYYTRTNNGPFYPGLNSVFDDQVIDGTTYDVQIEKGVDRNQTINMENYSFFSRGDSVTVKLANIDKATFDFWRTMEYNYSSIGNPFSTPTTVLGNISNEGLGYFGGYAAQYKTLIIPK